MKSIKVILPGFFLTPIELIPSSFLLILFSMQALAVPIESKSPEPTSVITTPYESNSLQIEEIDYNRINDTNYTAELLSRVCRVFSFEEAQRLSSDTFAIYNGSAKLPMPHNVKHDFLMKSQYIKAVISGASPAQPERNKAICLNHLAFVISRQIPYYFFYNPTDFKHMADVYPHALKVPAMKYMLSKIPEGKWVLWIDDDVVTSDFMPFSYEQTNTLEGESKNLLLTPVQTLTDRAIIRASSQVAEDNKNRKERAKRRGEEYKPRPNPPHLIASKDQGSWDAHLNTGMVWVKNTRTGNALLDLWWSRILKDNFPVTDYFCHSNNKHYENLQDCLTGCGISKPMYYYQCGPSPKQEEWMRQHAHKRFDQEVLKRLLKENEDERPEVMDSVELIPQNADFGLKQVPESPASDGQKEEDFIEGLNVFFRSHISHGQAASQVGYDPTVDRWVHVSGLAAKQKNDYLALWLSRIMNYPVRNKVQFSNNDLYPMEAHLIREGWVCNAPPPCEHNHEPCQEKIIMDWTLTIPGMLAAYVAGMGTMYIYRKRYRLCW